MSGVEMPMSRSVKIMCKSSDLTLRAMSDFAIHRTADTVGEANPLLSMTAP